MSKLDYETIGCKEPKQLIIWLHGLGADGYNFMPIAQSLALKDTSYVFPHAPMRPISLNGGMVMRGWYDVYSLEKFEREDVEGMYKARDNIHELIDDQIKAGFDSNEIILAGFSQGGVLALLAGLSYSKPLKGIIALSCYLPLHHQLPEYTHDNNKHTPIFLAHGTLDEVVEYKIGEVGLHELEKNNYRVEWHRYVMDHEVCEEEVNDMREYIIKQSRER